jgi:hypothetical protein
MPALTDRNAELSLRVVQDGGGAEPLVLILDGAEEDSLPEAPPVESVTATTHVQFHATTTTAVGTSALVTGALEMLVRADDTWRLSVSRKGAGTLVRTGDGSERVADVWRQLHTDLGLDPSPAH